MRERRRGDRLAARHDSPIYHLIMTLLIEIVGWAGAVLVMGIGAHARWRNARRATELRG